MNNKVRYIIIYIGLVILIFTVNFFYQGNKRSEVEEFGVNLIAKFVHYKKFPKVSNYYFEFYYNKNKIKYFIEQLNDSENVQIKGWAFLKETNNNSNDSIFIVLTNDSKTYITKTRLETRLDISQVYNQGNLDNSGFRATIFKNNIEQGIYNLGIAIKDKNSNFIFDEVEPKTPIRVKTSLKISEIYKLPEHSKDAKGNLDLVEASNDMIKIRGWITKLKSDNSNRKINILLINKKNKYIVETVPEIRKDVTNSYNDGFNYDNSGFNLEIDKTTFKKGAYKILILLEGEENVIFDSNKIIKN